MAGPFIEPDPDLRAAESGAATTLRATAKQMLDTETAVQEQITTTANHNAGDGADRAASRLTELRISLNAAAAAVTHAAELHEALAAAAERYRASAPTGLEILAAWAVAQKAKQELAAAADSDHGGFYAAAKRASVDADAKLRELEDRRHAAVEAFNAARDHALDVYRTGSGAIGVGDGTPLETPPALAPAPTTALAPAAPAVSAPPTDAGAPPAAATPAAAETATAAAPSSSGSPAAAAALAGLLAQQQQPQQTPAAMPQPQMAMPAPVLSPPQPQRPAEQPFGDGVIDDPNMILSALRSAASPSPTFTAPAFTPVAVTEPALTPLNPLSAAPAVNPVAAAPIVTGTSTAGLITDTNVTGRPDNAPPRTATSTHLAGAGAVNATAGETGAGQRAAAAVPPMMPMMPPMMGGPGMGGGGEKREPVTAALTPDQAELMGLETVAEAVPGGTIARKGDAA